MSFIMKKTHAAITTHVEAEMQERALAQLTMLSYILNIHTDLIS